LTTKKPASIVFLDDKKAPVTFADAASGLWDHGGSIRITLETCHASHHAAPAPLNRVVIGRLVMPRAGAKAMANMILDYLGRLEVQADPIGPQSAPPSAILN
jgi:hypothetical protein